ncbi:unknown [Klebsiella variicola CAG:634]|nr:unknown [Klebsiella variicola CAG:634]
MHFAGASADDNYWQVTGHLTDTPADLQAIDARQHQIKDHRIPDLLFQLDKGLVAVGFMHNLIALILKIEPQQRGNILVIFHQQNGFSH